MSVTQEAGARRLTAGVDWARDDHAVAVVSSEGEQLERFSVQHRSAGLRELVHRLLAAGVEEVGIERPDGPVVETLLQAGLTVFVIPPGQLKNLRGRYGSAGNKDDRFDAYVLADTVRTDRRRLRPLVADSAATVTLRMLTRARKDLVGHRVALANQLRAHLQLAFPGAVGLFADIDSQVSRRFLARFPTQASADWLSPRRLEAWLASVGYCGRRAPAALHAHLAGAPQGTRGPEGEARAHVTRALLAALDGVCTQIGELGAKIAEQLALHEDAPLFQALPRAGTVRAARLLAEIGDCRARFPTPESLSCLAGVAPSTRQSGKTKVVSFRWAADKQLRDAVCDFAGDSRRASPWAAQLYQRAIARGHDHPHATRILARAWLHVIWACWQTKTPYDPTKHRAARALSEQPESTAA
jgi:transposase